MAGGALASLAQGLIFAALLLSTASAPSSRARRPCPHAIRDAEQLREAVAALLSEELHSQALACLVHARESLPKDADVAFQLGRFLSQSGSPSEAVEHLRAAAGLHRGKGRAEVHSALGWALIDAGRGQQHPEATRALSQAVALRAAGSPVAREQVVDMHQLALMKSDEGDVAGGLELLQALVRSGVVQAQVFNSLGTLYRRAGMAGEAAAAFGRAVDLSGDNSRLRYNLGVALEDAGKPVAALEHFEAAQELNPAFAEAGIRVSDLRRKGAPPDLRGAVEAADRAASHRPEWFKPLYVRAQAEADLEDYAAAIRSLRAALPLAASSGSTFWEAEVFFTLLHLEQFTCAWDRSASRQAALVDLVSRELRSLGEGDTPAIRPLQALVYLPAPLLAAVSRSFAAWADSEAARRCPKTAASSIKKSRAARRKDWSKGGPSQIRIGYVSADFGDHAVGHLLRRIWPLHDRTKFSVYCYSLTADDGSVWYSGAQEDCDKFSDVSRSEFHAVAADIASDGIDILVDLGGYTRRSKAEIFALRPAPLQVGFMGWAASTHSPNIAYTVADRVVAPPSLAAKYFSEKIVYSPNSYYVNDYQHMHADSPILSTEEIARVRQREGLPPVTHGAVLACFNQHFKFDRETLQIWTGVLRRVPSATLWVLDWGNHAVKNLQAELLAAGLPRSRMVVSQVFPIEQHLMRIAAADLFLDTFAYGGHTTAADALWAGVPVVSLPSEKMATRVSASLSAALSCVHSTASSMQAFEDLLVRLAQPGENVELAELKRCVRQNARDAGSRLFNTPLWVANYEELLQAAWELELAGLPSGHVHLAGNRPREVGDDVFSTSNHNQ